MYNKMFDKLPEELMLNLLGIVEAKPLDPEISDAVDEHFWDLI